MSISYEYYKIFYYVGKYKSFSKAAKALNNSQPNITRTMNKLEFELDCKLFIRSKKGVTLTAEGKSFSPTSKQLTNRSKWVRLRSMPEKNRRLGISPSVSLLE